MTEWKMSQCAGDTIPTEFLIGASSKYVYQRRNIQKKSTTNTDGTVTEYYEYEERKLSYNEYLTEFGNVQEAKIEQNRADIDYIMAMTDIE
jgi:hypothetical protein